MDNKLTKSRIANFFAYEWIVLILIAIVGIVAWELLYGITAVRPTVGQQFKYYYDYDIYSPGASGLHDELRSRGAFSYDVLKFDMESLTADYDVLSTRLSIQEGDAIFSETLPDKKKEDLKKDEYNTCRANNLIDNYNIYDFDTLVKDAKAYLSQFLKTTGEDPLVYENLDEAKMDAHFLARNGKDNRFRSDEEKASGKIQERGRIKKLCVDTLFLEKVLDADTQLKNTLTDEEYAVQSYFYSYRKYEQTYYTTEDNAEYKQDYKNLFDKQTVKRYGLKMNKLTSDDPADKKVSDYMQISGSDGSVDNVVLLVFNFKEEQPALQYETISFTSQLVRMFSDKFN